MSIKSVNQLKFGTVLSYLSLAMSVAVSLVYTPIMLQKLGESEYGVYQLALSVVSYLNLLYFGLGSAYTRYYSRYRVQEDTDGMARLNGMFLSLYCVLGTVVLLLGCFLAAGAPALFANSNLTEEEVLLTQKLMYILSVNAALAFPISVFESHVMVNEQYLFQKVVALGKTVFNPLVMIPLLLMGFRSVAMVCVTLFFTVLSGVINVVYCLRSLRMKFLFKRFDGALLKEMFGYTAFIFIGVLVDQLNWSVDTLILGLTINPTAVTIYSLAGNQLNQYYTTMSTTFTGLLTPRVHRLVAAGSSDSELSALFTRVGRLQFLLMSMILLGFIAVGRPFVICWCGGGTEEVYTITYYITIALFIPTLLPAIQNLGIEIQRAKNMHKFRSLVYLGVAIGNIIISIPLCLLFSHFGNDFAALYGEDFVGSFAGLGCAVGTAISVFVGNVLLMNWYYHKHIGLDIPAFWKSIAKMLPGMLIPTAIAVLMALFLPMENTYGTVLLYGLLFVVVYAVSVWFLSMNRYEKELVLTPLRRMFSRFKKA